MFHFRWSKLRSLSGSDIEIEVKHKSKKDIKFRHVSHEMITDWEVEETVYKASTT